MKLTFNLLPLIWISLFQSSSFAQIEGKKLPLYYDEATGNVTVDTTEISGGEFVSYAFTHNLPKEPSFTFENHTPFMNNLLSPNSTYRSIAESSWPNEPMPPGVYSIGNILPAGMTQDEIQVYFNGNGRLSDPIERTPFTYVAFGSFDLKPPQYHVFEINYAPSPFPPLNMPDGGESEVVQWATEVSLLYDPSDGGLILDTSGPNGGRSFGYSIYLTQDLFRVDEFVPATKLDLWTASPNNIGESSRIDAGRHYLGNVLPPNLGLDQLEGLIDTARFVGEPGRGFGAIDVFTSGHPMAIGIVPEPSGQFITLLACFWIALSVRRFN